MGASNFDTVVYTTKSMQEAYREACDDAIHLDGHNGSNGTISTTRGVVASPLSSTPIREDQVDWDAVSSRLRRLKKRGHCEALPIKRVQEAQHDEVGVIEVEARMQSHLFERSASHEERHDAIKKAFLREARKALKAGEMLNFIHPTLGRIGKGVTAGDVNMSALSVHQVVATPEKHAVRTSTKATPGRTETRYFIVSGGQQEMPLWEKGFASQSEARARLPKDLRDTRFPRQAYRESYEIISMTRRASGEALVTHEVSLGERGKTVPVRLKGRLMECTRKAKVTGETGWVFYGYAAS